MKKKDTSKQLKKLPNNELVFYQSHDGLAHIEVLYAEQNIWLSQKRMAELFACSPDNVSLHLKNIYADQELDEYSTTEDFSVVQDEGGRQIKRTVKNINRYKTKTTSPILIVR